MAIQSKGLNLVPKLKQEHVKLMSYARMRVDLAAQVYKCTCIQVNEKSFDLKEGI